MSEKNISDTRQNGNEPQCAIINEQGNLITGDEFRIIRVKPNLHRF